MNKLYIIGSLRNPKINEVASTLRVRLGVEVFDDWFAAGPEADDYWKKYEEAKGHSYEEALAGYAATHVFNFDKLHLDTADAAVLVLPAGRSAHLEAGYMVGQGKPVFILLDEVSGNLRWDVMYKFVTGVVRNVDDLVDKLQSLGRRPEPFPYPSFGGGGVQPCYGPALGSAGNWRAQAQADWETSLVGEEVLDPPRSVHVKPVCEVY